jgi:hypothetical protein
MDETDDGMLLQGSEEHGNFKSACEEEEGTDCEYGDTDNDWYRLIESDMNCELSFRVNYFFPNRRFSFGGCLGLVSFAFGKIR